MRILDLPGITKLSSGKVREIFDLGDQLLLVATDRISAFDFILNQTVPDKGKVLNLISSFWFDQLKDIIPNHKLSVNPSDYPKKLAPFADQLAGRSMLVRKTKVVKLECIVRGYITGSGWKDYQQTGAVCGITLPKGLQKSEKLKTPLFTPSTKAEIGEHDENIKANQAREIVGADIFDKVEAASLKLYSTARDYAETKGIIIADTKFEFGIAPDGQLMLIDEALTPDSSRFWPMDSYRVGEEQPSYDKQFVRNYLLSLDWNKQAPVPDLPENIVSKTREKYLEAYSQLTGKSI